MFILERYTSPAWTESVRFVGVERKWLSSGAFDTLKESLISPFLFISV